MKLTSVFRVLLGIFVVASAFAQDYAPDSIANRRIMIQVGSGTGQFARTGVYFFAPSTTTYVADPVTLDIVRSTGTYTYTKTAFNAASITANDSLTGGSISQRLTFASPDSGTYTISGAAGTQSGNFYFIQQTRGELINISTRGQVAPNSALVAGFVVRNAGQRLLLRAAGPSLGAFGVPGTLSNPMIRVYNASGVTVITNDEWGNGSADVIESVARQVGAFPFSSRTSRDAAVVLTLQPGAYTVEVSSSDAAPAAERTGTALVEVYSVQ